MKKTKLFICLFGIAMCLGGILSTAGSLEACCQCNKPRQEKPEHEREKDYNSNYNLLEQNSL